MTQEKSDPEKKIIIDEDWKSQAEAEKQRLAEAEQSGPQAGAAGEAGLPPSNFTTLVTEVVTQAYFAMGAIADPRGRRFRDMGLAKHHIDMLAVIEEKTKGNLSEEEKTLLDNALYECRMMFVNLAQKGA
jgi:hypothetical protein